MLLGSLFFRPIAQVASLALILLRCQCKAGSFSIYSKSDILPRAALVERDVSATPSCGFWFTTDNTTTCAQILTTYNLQASAFVALNPWQGVYDKSTTVNTTGCGGVLAYETYCVAPGVSNTISMDGKCGPSNDNAVCPGSSFGSCCSVSGWCGNGYSFCGIGNCIGGNCVNGTGWSTDGKCGIQPLQPRCGGQFGVCCSNAGWCGNGTAYCDWENCAAGACSPPPYTSIKPTATAGQQCQAGSCWTSLPPTGPVEGSTVPTTTTKTTSSVSSTKTTSTPAATPTSVDGSCGVKRNGVLLVRQLISARIPAGAVSYPGLLLTLVLEGNLILCVVQPVAIVELLRLIVELVVNGTTAGVFKIGIKAPSTNSDGD
ncbi:uncharacterized protein DFL_000612 [Arthrobotrys flagrans]|uniref:Chitin-binding type-1 domain-containing protein n=1 Tax=Arthrobotrys flagrans TaxID=97331 RepID=A0A437AEQ9_ARTFL|nr:hypothetical protein DFL_000612 [Arthrobotrys flagrans]